MHTVYRAQNYHSLHGVEARLFASTGDTGHIGQTPQLRHDMNKSHTAHLACCTVMYKTD